MAPIYIGVDFHARQQTICYLKTETGELVISEPKHQDKEQVRAFYQQFPSPVIVGLRYAIRHRSSMCVRIRDEGVATNQSS